MKTIPFFNPNTYEWTKIVLRKEITSRDVIKSITATFVTDDDDDVLTGHVTTDTGEEIPFYEYVPPKLTIVIGNDGKLRSFREESEAGRWVRETDAPIILQVRRWYDENWYLRAVWDRICTVDELCKFIVDVDVLCDEYITSLRKILPYASAEVYGYVLHSLAIREKAKKQSREGK